MKNTWDCRWFWCPFTHKSLCGLSAAGDYRCPPHGHEHVWALRLPASNKLAQLPLSAQINTLHLAWRTVVLKEMDLGGLIPCSGPPPGVWVVWFFFFFFLSRNLVRWYVFTVAPIPCEDSKSQNESDTTHKLFQSHYGIPWLSDAGCCWLPQTLFKWSWLWDLILSVQTLSPLSNMCFIMQRSGALCSVQHSQSFKVLS